MAFDSDENLFIADTVNYVIQKVIDYKRSSPNAYAHVKIRRMELQWWLLFARVAITQCTNGII